MKVRSGMLEVRNEDYVIWLGAASDESHSNFSPLTSHIAGRRRAVAHLTKNLKEASVTRAVSSWPIFRVDPTGRCLHHLMVKMAISIFRRPLDIGKEGVKLDD